MYPVLPWIEERYCPRFVCCYFCCRGRGRVFPPSRFSARSVSSHPSAPRKRIVLGATSRISALRGLALSGAASKAVRATGAATPRFCSSFPQRPHCGPPPPARRDQEPCSRAIQSRARAPFPEAAWWASGGGRSGRGALPWLWREASQHTRWWYKARPSSLRASLESCLPLPARQPSARAPFPPLDAASRAPSPQIADLPPSRAEKTQARFERSSRLATAPTPQRRLTHPL